MNKYFYKGKINKEFKKSHNIKDNWAIGSLIITEFMASPITDKYKYDIATYNNCYITTIRQKKNSFADWGMPYQYEDILVDKETVGKFTNIYDINGSPIFINDLIECDVGNRKYIYKIYENDIGQIKWECVKESNGDIIEKTLTGNFTDVGFWSSHAKIIGNIYNEEETI